MVLAVGQAVGSALASAYGGRFTTADRAGEPPIVPVGGTFSIWGVIIAVSVAYAIWAFPGRGPDVELRNRLAVPLAVVFVGFNAWLVAAELEPNWATLAVFVVLLAALLRALRLALRARAAIAEWSLLGRGLLWTMLGLYTGWSSIAIWLNLTTGMAGSGAPITGPVGVAAQLAILAGATATAVLLIAWTQALPSYALAVGWAFGGATLGALAAGEPVLAGASATGLLVVAVAFAIRRSARRSPLGEPAT